MILFIYGAGGDGREEYDLVQRNKKILEQYSKVLFLDDNHSTSEYYGTKIVNISDVNDYIQKEKSEFVPAVGEPVVRQALLEKGIALGMTLTTLIDESATVSPTAKIHAGCVIRQDVFVSSMVEVEEGTLLQPACHLGHDIHIGRCCVISTGVSVGGSTNIGDRVYVGLNAAIRQGLLIGNDSIIAMGSVVYHDVGENLTLIGNPARVTRGNDQHKALFE